MPSLSGFPGMCHLVSPLLFINICSLTGLPAFWSINSRFLPVPVGLCGRPSNAAEFSWVVLAGGGGGGYNCHVYSHQATSVPIPNHTLHWAYTIKVTQWLKIGPHLFTITPHCVHGGAPRSLQFYSSPLANRKPRGGEGNLCSWTCSFPQPLPVDVPIPQRAY